MLHCNTVQCVFVFEAITYFGGSEYSSYSVRTCALRLFQICRIIRLPSYPINLGMRYAEDKIMTGNYASAV